MTQPFISPDVKQVYHVILDYLGPSFSLDALLDFLGTCRGKSVLLEEQQFPIGITGYCFAFEDVDLIVVRDQLDPRRRLATCLHECAHFFLRHIPRTSAGTLTTTFAEFIRQHREQDGLRLRTWYDEPHEHAAEMLATLLISHIDADTDTIPQTICEMYGYGSHV